MCKTVRNLMKKAAVLLLGLILGMCVGIENVKAAPVPYCQALTLTGNAYNQRVCTSLSDSSQETVVCEFPKLADGTDVHSTLRPVRDNEPFHISVYRGGSSKGKSQLAGVWTPENRNLTIERGQPDRIDGVMINPYVAQLNGVDAEYPCKESFLQAAITHEKSEKWKTDFVDKCKKAQCG